MFYLHYVDLTSFVHSTESEKKVIEAMLICSGIDDESLIQKEGVQGGKFNSMQVFNVRLKNTKQMKAHLEFIKELKGVLSSQKLQRLDEKLLFHFRIKKQPIFDKRAVLVENDVSGDIIRIKWKIRCYPTNTSEALNKLDELFEQLQ